MHAEPVTSKKWGLYSFLLILLVFFLLVARWPLLPNFIDIYYHLLSAEGFLEAGGYSAHDFWSWAPAGRPHLYPPLFHCLLFLLLKTGIPPLAVARLCDVFIFPLFLLSLWACMRCLCGEKEAFFGVLLGSSVYSLYLAGSSFMPATLACAFGLLSLCAAERGRKAAAALLLALCFYTHAQIPWLFCLAFLIGSALRRAPVRTYLGPVLAALFLASPFFVFLFFHRRSFQPQQAHERFILELSLYGAVALYAAPAIIRERRSSVFAVALALAALPFAFSYPYRYASGQGMIGWLMLAACGLERLSAPVLRRGKAGVPLLMLAFLIVSPTILITPRQGASFSVFNSTYRNLVYGHSGLSRPNEYSVASSRFMNKLVSLVRGSSVPGENIYANLERAGTVLAALSGRHDTGGMLSEVAPARRSDPFHTARIFVWFKDPGGRVSPGLERLTSAPAMRHLAQTGIADVFVNDAAMPPVPIPPATIPFVWLCIIAAGILTALFYTCTVSP